MTPQCPTQRYPLVTCAIPLYRSKRFVDRIIRNIEAIDYPSVEVLISDRHCEDDALESLMRRFAGDSRIGFIRKSDRLNWVEHYNALIEEGRGKYSRWMPHDDEFPVCALRDKVALMERDTGVVMVYGPVRAFDDTREFLSERSNMTPNPPNEALWMFAVPIFLYFRALAPGAFKGLFRRDLVMRHRMTIRPTHNLAASERLWLVGVALLGRFHFLETWQYRKYYYPDSMSRRFVNDRRVTIDAFRISLAYLYLARVERLKLLGGAAALFILTARRLFPDAANRWFGRLLPDDRRLTEWLNRL